MLAQNSMAMNHTAVAAAVLLRLELQRGRRYQGLPPGRLRRGPHMSLSLRRSPAIDAFYAALEALST